MSCVLACWLVPSAPALRFPPSSLFFPFPASPFQPAGLLRYPARNFTTRNTLILLSLSLSQEENRTHQHSTAHRSRGLLRPGTGWGQGTFLGWGQGAQSYLELIALKSGCSTSKGLLGLRVGSGSLGLCPPPPLPHVPHPRPAVNLQEGAEPQALPRHSRHSHGPQHGGEAFRTGFRATDSHYCEPCVLLGWCLL